MDCANGDEAANLPTQIRTERSVSHKACSKSNPEGGGNRRMKLCQHGLCRQGKSVEDQDIVVGRICPKKVASLQPTIAEDEALDQMRAQKVG